MVRGASVASEREGGSQIERPGRSHHSQCPCTWGKRKGEKSLEATARKRTSGSCPAGTSSVVCCWVVDVNPLPVSPTEYPVVLIAGLCESILGVNIGLLSMGERRVAMWTRGTPIMMASIYRGCFATYYAKFLTQKLWHQYYCDVFMEQEIGLDIVRVLPKLTTWKTATWKKSGSPTSVLNCLVLCPSSVLSTCSCPPSRLSAWDHV